MKKILCPVNFTGTALNALEYACNLANIHKGILTLFHVVTNDEYNEMLQNGAGDLSDHIERGTLETDQKLNSLCNEISKSYSDIICRKEIGYGSLSVSVNEFARGGKYDLIVMGNDGVADITEAMDGSSVIKVAEQAPCPVLCVPFQAEFQGLQKVVYGTEFRKTDREALHHLILLLEPVGSYIDVVHYFDSGKRDEKEENEFRMENLKSYLNYKKIRYHLRKTEGSIRLDLDNFMQEVKGEMLVMITHQRGFFERVFQNSNTKNMSYFAEYPILIYLEENLIKK